MGTILQVHLLSYLRTWLQSFWFSKKYKKKQVYIYIYNNYMQVYLYLLGKKSSYTELFPDVISQVSSTIF